ncbi:MAG: hypothetical protein J5758_01540, partial [Abditibacteriota bacterium]|nr:hypothetical protein [Abditibacteriota bacterium]
VIPSLHPSYILRNMYKDGDGGKSLLIADIEAARRKVIDIKRSLKHGDITSGPAGADQAPSSDGRPDETGKKIAEGFGF